jgi:hypothetical protein
MMKDVPPENDDFHIDLRFSGQDKHTTYLVASIAAVVGIAFIVLTMTTGVAAWLLPMEDQYLQVLVPVAADGAEPLSLKALEHEINDKRIAVHGTVANRTDYNISNVIAVVEMQDTTGRFSQTLEVPVEPIDLPPQASGNFMASATLQEKPAGYVIKFRLADGPFLPHKDDRAATFGVTGK